MKRSSRCFKFVFDRKAFLAGEHGLKPLSKDDPADFGSFGDAVLWGHAVDTRKNDVDGETFIAGKYNTVRQMPASLDTCVKCHRETVRGNFFTGGPRLGYLQTDHDQADAAVIKKKEAREEWTLYLRLRDAKGK